MRTTHSKVTLFALGLASCSFPCAAFAVGEPAAATAYSAPFTAKEIRPQKSTAGGVLALASVPPVNDRDLEGARGGFTVGGLNFNFGASVQTLVNGQLALQTNVQWTSTGAVVTQLQGLGTSIQNQVASNLANAGINVPATNSAAGATSNTSPVSSAVSNMPSTVGNSAPSNSGALPTASGTPASSAVASPTTVSNPPASATTVPVSFVNVSPTASGTGPTSSVLSSLIGQNGLQSSPGSGASSAQPQTANSQVTTVAVVPSNTGSPAASGTANIASAAGSVTPASNSPTSPVNNAGVMNGVQIQSPTGTTQVLANVANGQIQSVVLNSASNQNITQNTNIVLTIYNFASWQQQLIQHAMSMQLANQVLAASGFTGGR